MQRLRRGAEVFFGILVLALAAQAQSQFILPNESGQWIMPEVPADLAISKPIRLEIEGIGRF